MAFTSGCAALDDVMAGVTSSEIDATEWDGQLIHIDFAEDTTGDEFGIQHEFDDGYDEMRYVGEIPEFGGRVSVDFRDVVPGSTYPNNNFEIVVYEGSIGGFLINVEEELDRVKVSVPEENFASGTFDG
ncbi:hypothetical protein [Halorubrum tibetense]|uniref:Uncharacterized protein n=1 Tax=Halorubrum tibetense TaxID=175631 RepID=A0ABD5SGC5_9EURY